MRTCICCRRDGAKRKTVQGRELDICPDCESNDFLIAEALRRAMERRG